jgi:hydroxymethylbilane synthase
MKRPLVMATRRSALALAQARAFVAHLRALEPAVEIEELLVTTSGDRFQDRPLQAIGGKGLFIKEIEEALVGGRADLAVHSIKDVPAELAAGLCIGAVPAREDPRDALVSRLSTGLAALPEGARLGTSSLRRRTLLLRARPDLDVQALRGNVDTRLRKVERGEVDAVVLAYAGLRRLGLEARATEVLDPSVCLPAVGQGALGIECRDGDAAVRELLGRAEDALTRTCVAAERAFMAAVGGSCLLPVAAYAARAGSELWLRAMVAEPDGRRARFGERRAPWPAGPLEAERVGTDLGAELRR